MTFPDSVKTIERYGFTWCHSQTDLVIGDGVETIGDYGFGNCNNLRSVYLGSNIKEMEGAFRYFDMSKTSRLEAVYFTGDVPIMNQYTFYKDIEATCYYPAGNRTWTEDVLQNYGGILTWVPFGFCDGAHSYNTEVFPATCENGGYTEYWCTVCGDSYIGDYVAPGEPDPNPHTPVDITGYGVVNNKDLTRLFRYLSGFDVEVNEAALDITGDGSVNNKDLTRLFRYLSGYEVEIH